MNKCEGFGLVVRETDILHEIAEHASPLHFEPALVEFQFSVRLVRKPFGIEDGFADSVPKRQVVEVEYQRAATSEDHALACHIALIAITEFPEAGDTIFLFHRKLAALREGHDDLVEHITIGTNTIMQSK